MYKFNDCEKESQDDTLLSAYEPTDHNGALKWPLLHQD